MRRQCTKMLFSAIAGPVHMVLPFLNLLLQIADELLCDFTSAVSAIEGYLGAATCGRGTHAASSVEIIAEVVGVLKL